MKYKMMQNQKVIDLKSSKLKVQVEQFPTVKPKSGGEGEGS